MVCFSSETTPFPHSALFFVHPLQAHLQLWFQLYGWQQANVSLAVSHENFAFGILDIPTSRTQNPFPAQIL